MLIDPISSCLSGHLLSGWLSNSWKNCIAHMAFSAVSDSNSIILWKEQRGKKTRNLKETEGNKEITSIIFCGALTNLHSYLFHRRGHWIKLYSLMLPTPVYDEIMASLETELYVVFPITCRECCSEIPEDKWKLLVSAISEWEEL